MTQHDRGKPAEVLGWCPDCDGPLYRREIKTMEGVVLGPVCTLCGPVEQRP